MKRPHGGALDPTLLDFSASINPLGPPEAVREVLLRAPDLATRYPSPDARELCEALACHHGVPAACVLAGNGSTQLIYLVAQLLSGTPAWVVTPAFTEYEDACEACGLPLTRTRPGVTFVGNPTSPEGRLLAREDVLALPGTVIVDEAFMEFAGDRESLVRRAAEDPRLVVLRSLTKFYALPGLRLGYLVAVPAMVERLRRLQPPWSVNALAGAAGRAALADPAYRDRTRRVVRELRDELVRGLREVGLLPSPSEANFVLCRVPDAGGLCRALRESGIVARNCDSFTGLPPNRYVRFAVRPRPEQERLLGVLREVVPRCSAGR